MLELYFLSIFLSFVGYTANWENTCREAKARVAIKVHNPAHRRAAFIVAMVTGLTFNTLLPVLNTIQSGFFILGMIGRVAIYFADRKR